ncbi:hypothetical protein M406DRAFT_216237, partial [Cryphonectria parasitica EP155]
GSRSGFQTDSSISSGRLGDRRELQRWDAGDATGNGLVDGGLEDSTDSHKPWDQFAVNEKKFGVQSDYDENLYTTPLDRSRPDYKDAVARADRLARKIEGSNATSAHAAEERMMDHVAQGDDGADEEDKYSGVKRADFPPLGSQATNKYTPPARRAPTGSATVKGAPVDPAIISSQLRAAPNNTSSRQTTSRQDDTKSPVNSNKAPQPQKSSETTKPAEPTSKEEAKPVEGAIKAQSDVKPAEKPTAALRSSLTVTRNGAVAAKENQPIEKEVLAAFKSFGDTQRQIQKGKEKAAKSKKLDELKAFAAKFKLGTPVPNDLIGIIAKDPKKQQEIQDKARKNAEEVQRAKDEAKKVDTKTQQGVAAPKPAQSKSSEHVPASSSGTETPASATESRTTSRQGPAQPQHASAGSAAGANRHPGNRQSYTPGSYQQQYRGDRGQGQNLPRHNQQGSHLAQHLRNGEQQRMMQQPHRMAPDARMPPTGPAANNMGPAFPPRHAGVPPGHMVPGPRLNPNTQEFRPNAQPFIPAGPSAASSPRSAMNNVAVDHHQQTATPPVLTVVIRRKIKPIDIKKCFILSHVQSFKAPQTNKPAWEENGGLRPAFDTLPTWKSIREEDSKDKISYKQLFDRPPYTTTMATPNPAPVVPQIPHQHQLPFHLQQGAQNAGPRQSPHMPPMQMHGGGHPAHGPHMPFNNGEDGTRMMHSNSAQSYASPRPGQVPMAYPNMMNSPSHMPYSQPVMPGFMGPGAPPMGGPQMRNFTQNPQYMPQQHGQMGPPMMMGPGYMAAPSPMMQGTPQMPMAYPGAHPNFVPPGPVPPQAMQGANGYPSPGRPAAPMMAHQGSQQGQHMYGMSPGAMPQYQQPVFTPQQPGQMGNMRVHNNPGPQQLVGTSPQQVHQHGPQHRGNNF